MPEQWDTSELDALAASFRAAPAKAMLAIVPTANRAGANIKRTMRADASGHRHLPRLQHYVEYDVDASPTEVSVEVGFRQEGQGNLANIAAFGSVNNSPVMDITRGLHAEVPKFMRWAAQAAAEAL